MNVFRAMGVAVLTISTALYATSCRKDGRKTGRRPPAGESATDVVGPAASATEIASSSEEGPTAVASPPDVPSGATPSDRCARAGRLVQGRYSASATALADGRVLIAGGRLHDGEDFLKSVETFDPKSGTSAPGPPLAVARALHAAMRLRDGRVLVAGGYTALAQYGAAGPPKPEPPVELFEPTRAQWQSVGRYGYYGNAVGLSVTELKDGRVLLAGGDALNFGRVSPDAVAFDPRRSVLLPLPRMPGGRAFHFVREEEDGTVRMWGGIEYGFDESPSAAAPVELAPRGTAWKPWTPSEQALPPWWRALPEGAARDWHVVSGGPTAAPPIFITPREVRCFEPEKGAWVAAATFTVQRPAAAATLLDRGRLFVVGGTGGSEPEASAEVCTLPRVCRR